MDRLIYTAVSGLNASMVQQRVIASNMANAQTVGFRAEVAQFVPMTLDGASLEARAFNRADVEGALMRHGAVMPTGRGLDVALEGDALLAVQAADGSEGYTRRGDLSIAASGVLQNGEGRVVLGESGPVTVPAGSQVSIAPDGAVMMANPAAPDQPPVQIDRLKLVDPRGSTIEKDLTGLFRVVGGGVLPVDAEARLTPGSLEQSNVNMPEVLVEMIEAQRLFDIRTKVIATARDVDQGSASLMRLNA